jgi:hypothetical protein
MFGGPSWAIQVWCIHNVSWEFFGGRYRDELSMETLIILPFLVDGEIIESPT